MVVVLLMLLLLLIRCWLLLPLWDSVIVLCFVVHYFVSILVLRSPWWWRESWFALFVFLVSRGCLALPHDATGLSAVCDCGISWSYSLFFRQDCIYNIENTNLEIGVSCIYLHLLLNIDTHRCSSPTGSFYVLNINEWRARKNPSFVWGADRKAVRSQIKANLKNIFVSPYLILVLPVWVGRSENYFF